MKRFMTGAAAVLIAGGHAQAGATFSATRTGTNINGFDEITFLVTGFNDVGSPDASTAGNGITSLQGTFTAIGTGAELAVPGANEAQARSRTTNTDFEARENPAESYVNFDTVVLTAGDFARTPLNDPTPTAFKGTWFTTGSEFFLRPTNTPDSLDLDNTILAQVYVTPGADVSFSGLFNTATGATGVNQPISVTSVPEPTTLGAMTAGALAVLARRRTRRAGTRG